MIQKVYIHYKLLDRDKAEIGADWLHKAISAGRIMKNSWSAKITYLAPSLSMGNSCWQTMLVPNTLVANVTSALTAYGSVSAC